MHYMENDKNGATNDWEISKDDFPQNDIGVEGTIFSLANGYFGLRGSLDEENGYRGGFINGFYENTPITYGESAYGYPCYSQTMLNVFHGDITRIIVCGETFHMGSGKVENYKRVLSMREGTLKRNFVWTSPEGRKICISMERMVLFLHKHTAVFHFEVTPLNFSGNIAFESEIESRTANRPAGCDPRVGSGLEQNPMNIISYGSKKDFAYITGKTKRSNLALCCGISGGFDPKTSGTAEASDCGGKVMIKYTAEAKCGEKIKFNKFLCYTDSRQFEEDRLVDYTKSELNAVRAYSFYELKKEQKEFLLKYWNVCDVKIDGDPGIQKSIRYSMFQLLQSSGTDGKTSVGAKGLTGEGYSGHYFWDTEMYILPFFLYTLPEVSRKLLEYRYSILGKARARAKELGHRRGALFPWRTINGDECSSYFPAGTAQYHINADIAHAVRIYVEATGDDNFLCECGAEILFETARFWADLGFFNQHKGGKFCINEVTGPDEYNALVNNNCYTNLMAQENMYSAVKAASIMKKRWPEKYRMLCNKISLTEDEIKFWSKAADNMYIPYDSDLKIHLQDDGFLDKKPWDFKNTPNDYPLLLHYHPLVIYRYNVCKQADMVLSLLLFGSRLDFDQKKRDYDYYEMLTTHDSSLSSSIFCIMACELGYREKAFKYFKRSARMDLDNCNGNTADGIHTADMAGTWLCIVYGFGGMRLKNGALHFAPFLPDGWSGYKFHITFRGSSIIINVNKNGTEYRLNSGNPAVLYDGNTKIMLKSPGETFKANFGEREYACK